MVDSESWEQGGEVHSPVPPFFAPHLKGSKSFTLYPYHLNTRTRQHAPCPMKLDHRAKSPLQATSRPSYIKV